MVTELGTFAFCWNSRDLRFNSSPGSFHHRCVFFPFFYLGPSVHTTQTRRTAAGVETSVASSSRRFSWLTVLGYPGIFPRPSTTGYIMWYVHPIDTSTVRSLTKIWVQWIDSVALGIAIGVDLILTFTAIATLWSNRTGFKK